MESLSLRLRIIHDLIKFLKAFGNHTQVEIAGGESTTFEYEETKNETVSFFERGE